MAPLRRGNSYGACIRTPQDKSSAGREGGKNSLRDAGKYFLLAVSGLLRRRLIFVTGKGGVGKSTVATALGVLAARSGLRTIVAELAAQDRVRQSFGQDGEVFHELKLGENLFTISVDPQHAMDEYLRVKTGTGRPGARLKPPLPGLRDGHARDARAAEHGQGVGALPARAPHRGCRYLRPGDRRFAGRRTRRRHPAHAPDLRRDRPRGTHRPPGAGDRGHDRRPELHRHPRRDHGRGDAGQRDPVAARRARRRGTPTRRSDRQRPLSGAVYRRRARHPGRGPRSRELHP